MGYRQSDFGCCNLAGEREFATMTNNDYVTASIRRQFALLTMCLAANDLFPSPTVFFG